MSTCKCGKTLISKTTDLLINGSSQPIALNIASLVGTPKDILLESGQVFSTVTNKLNYQIGGGVGNTLVINTKLVIDHQIKVVIKTESGRVLGVKYVGSFNKQTVVDNIQFSSSDLIPYLTNDERLIIQFHSMCDFSTSDCCDKLPDFTITNILNTFCVRTTTTTTTSTTLPPTTTGTTTTGTTTTGTTTTGTTTTCAPWPEQPCVETSCSYATYLNIGNDVISYSEYQQYIAEHSCYNGEEINVSSEPCSFLNCTWVSVYTGDAPPAWELLTDACTGYNNGCIGNCGGCQYPEEFPPLENGVNIYTECDCVG